MSADIALTILTHHKCASNWLRRICRELERAGVIAYEVAGGTKQQTAIVANPLAPRVVLDVNAACKAGDAPHFNVSRIVHFVRDPRDALVSNYWSWLKSHANNTPEILAFRERAVNLSVEDGLLALLPDFPMGQQLQTWTNETFESVHLIRYEDLLTGPEATLANMFAHGGISIPPDIASKVMRRTSFEKLTGRKPGEEDVEAHFRKGVSGDWRVYFTPRLTEAFHASYGWLGPRLGYW